MSAHFASERSAVDLAADLAAAADRFADAVHDIDLIADRMRGLMDADAKAYWMRRDAERMVR